jgi:hypothetical protein
MTGTQSRLILLWLYTGRHSHNNIHRTTTRSKLSNLSKDKHCLRIMKNIYGGKESGRTWFQHLRKHLIHKSHYIQSQYGACVFYHKFISFIVYTDGDILINPSFREIFYVEVQENLHGCLGIRIERKSENIICQNHI